MKVKAIAAAVLAVTLTGNAWSRVVVLPRRRVAGRRPVYVYPRHRVVYYRSPCKKVVYLPPPPAPYIYRYDPRYERVEVDVEVEIDD